MRPKPPIDPNKRQMTTDYSLGRRRSSGSDHSFQLHREGDPQHASHDRHREGQGSLFPTHSVADIRSLRTLLIILCCLPLPCQPGEGKPKQ